MSTGRFNLRLSIEGIDLVVLTDGKIDEMLAEFNKGLLSLTDGRFVLVTILVMVGPILAIVFGVVGLGFFVLLSVGLLRAIE
jgi:hypothetical protein